MILVPESFAHRIVNLHGSAGAEWLNRLPSILTRCAERWRLKLDLPFPQLSYGYVAPALLKDETGVVLKLCMPNPELMMEIEALRLMQGRGAVHLLDADLEEGALLLERLEPGTPLSAICGADDGKATVQASSVMRNLWRSVPHAHSFPSVADWGKGFHRLREHSIGDGECPFPKGLVDEAEALFVELTDSMAEPVLLHGDLHHGNILAAAREPWLAIDPKGLVGEPAYEAGALLRNPFPELLAWHGLSRIMARRVEILAEELSLDKARLRGWGIAQAVLAAWWSFEDNEDDWQSFIAFAENLKSML